MQCLNVCAIDQLAELVGRLGRPGLGHGSMAQAGHMVRGRTLHTLYVSLGFVSSDTQFLDVSCITSV